MKCEVKLELHCLVLLGGWANCFVINNHNSLKLTIFMRLSIYASYIFTRTKMVYVIHSLHYRIIFMIFVASIPSMSGPIARYYFSCLHTVWDIADRISFASLQSWFDFYYETKTRHVGSISILQSHKVC